MENPLYSRFRWLPLGILMVASVGCASVPPREAAVRAQLPVAAVWAASAWGGAIPSGAAPSTPVASGAEKLSADAAVNLAFSGSPQARGLRAAFLVEVAGIDAVAAPGGIHFSWARLSPDAGLAKLALALAVPLDEWLTLPARQRQAYWDRAAAAQRAAFATLQLESRVREAWAKAVAGQRQAALLARAAETAELAAELATRYRDAGSLPLLEWNAQQQAAANALAAAAEAGVEAAAARAELANLLGLPSNDPRLVLPEALPPAPALADTTAAASAEQESQQVAAALRQRLDLLAARSAWMARQVHAGSSRVWSRLPSLAVGAERERETDGAQVTGPSLEAGWSPAGAAVVRGTNAEVDVAEAAAATLAVEVANDVRLRSLAYRRALDLDTLLGQHLQQLQAAVVADAQRQHSFMLAGPFDLLEQRRGVDELAARAEQQRLAAWSAWFALQQASGVAP
ncbi:MAG: hypothetical protein RJB26_103 [Pseudomonadota bacterium]